MLIKNHKNLIVWQKAMHLVEKVYSLTSKMPQKEVFVLSSQLLRATISIPSNIAEGFGRNSRPEFARFLNIAYGSAAEVETQLDIIARVYPNLNITGLETEIITIQKMIRGLTKKVKPHQELTTRN